MWDFGLLGAAGSAAGAFELITTEVLTSNQPSITFDNLGTYSSTYKHLQIRVAGRSNVSSGGDGYVLRFNGDTGSNYARHVLRGDGSSVTSSASTSQSFINGAGLTGNTNTTNLFSGHVIDILDAFSSTKNTTVRQLAGRAGSSNDINLMSGLWMNTASITTIFLGVDGGTNWLAGSRLSLYGIRG